MRIIIFMLIGILISLTVALSVEKDQKSKESPKKIGSAAAETVKAASNKALTSAKAGENRNKRTLLDYSNTEFLYPQIASRRGGYSQDGYYTGQNTVAQFPSQYNYQNYQPYPQYLEAPEPIIEIIIKDANETLGSVNPQPIVRKTKKKKEKVHVFYVNYKKDENNKLHLESPIASLNNDENEEEDEEEEVIEYPVTPQPPQQSTTLRTIIHPDSEKYQSNSGIHVTFGTEDKSKSHKGQVVLEEHNAESVQRQVVAVPVPLPQSQHKSHVSVESRQDFQGNARSPSFANNFYQSAANFPYQPLQQLPNQQSTAYFRPPAGNLNQQQFALNSQPNYYHKAPNAQKTFVNSPPTAQGQYQQQQLQQQQQQQSVRKPLAQVQQQIQQHLQQQSQYYVNHNQAYSQQQPQQQHQQHQQQPQQDFQYYNGLPLQKPSKPTKQQTIFFPTSPPKSQELPVRQAPQPYQPIKFRPTAASAPSQLKPTPISTKLENYHSKAYQFQRQPQFVQQPVFSVQSPTVPLAQHYKQQQQQQQQQQHQQQQHHQQLPTQQQQQPQQQQQQQPQQHQQHSHQTQSTNYQTNPIYLAQQRGQQQQQTYSGGQHQNKQTTNPGSGSVAPSGPSWLDIKPSRETELLKSIPKFEQHITETIQNNYHQPGQYQTKNQVMHDIPAPNLAPNSQQQSFYSNTNNFNTQSQLQSQAQPHTQPQPQPQPQYTNFVTTSAHQVESSTQAPQQFGESTDGQKVMVVTPQPPNIYQQYALSHYPTSEGNSQPQQNAHVASNVQSQDQAKNYFHQQQQQQQQQQYQQHQQPRQSGLAIQSESQPSSNGNSRFSVSTHHSDVFKELGQRKSTDTPQSQLGNGSHTINHSSRAQESTTTPAPANSKNLLQLPDEVPDDLRQQLLSSGILNNADISVLDYDKVGDIALENLPAEHLQHFYGAGGGAQISESKKVLTVVKPNGEKIELGKKELQQVKDPNLIALARNKDTKVVRFEGNASSASSAESSSSGGASAERHQYNRYLPLKINAANFPKPDVEELKGKNIQSVVVLAPVETQQHNSDGTTTAVEDSKEVKYLGGDLIKTLAKKPTKENFKRWLEKEARAGVDQQSVVLLVARNSPSTEQEIFMYDLSNSEVNKLNGELSSKFVRVAEENASAEDLDHGSTLDPNFLDSMMRKTVR